MSWKNQRHVEVVFKTFLLPPGCLKKSVILIKIMIKITLFYAKQLIS